MWSVGSMKGADLFGWEQAVASGAKRLYITEGELDAAALYQMLKRYNQGTEYADMEHAVVSLKTGASGAGKDLACHQDKIRRHFGEVVLVFDNDDAGQLAIEEALKIMPEALVASLPDKDANECLIKGKSKAAVRACLFESKAQKNTRIVWGEDLHQEAREPARPGELTWPFPKLNEMTRGIRYGETIYVGAGVKMGKSELLNALAAHFIVHHGVKVFMAKPEEANKKTYKLLAGKMTGNIFHDPNVDFNYDAFDRAGDMLKGKLAMVNLYQHLGWDTLKADIRAAATQGCKVVFVDPVTNLVNGMESGQANTKLQEIAQEVSAMAMDLGIVVFLFCHLNAPREGVSHEMGGAVRSVQFTGSRAMMRSCNYMIGLQGNKDPDLPLAERCLRELIVLEDREFGVTGKSTITWNPNTSLYTEL